MSNNIIMNQDMKTIYDSVSNVEELFNSTFLVTGANGMIASYFIEFLTYLNANYDANIKIVALARSKERASKRFSQYLDSDSFKLVISDVSEIAEIEGEIDYIFHTASPANPKEMVTDPVGVIKANTIGTLNMLELAKNKKSNKIIFASSREVYGDTSTLNIIKETDYGYIDPLNVRSCYPESKKTGEALFEAYYNQYGVCYNCLRFASIYGPGMKLSDSRIMPDILGAVVEGKEIKLLSDGSMSRAFCYLTDAISATLTCFIKGERRGAYNVGNETEDLTILEVAELATKIRSDVKIIVTHEKPTEVQKMSYTTYKRIPLSTEKLQRLGWVPSISLAEGMSRTVRFNLGKNE